MRRASEGKGLYRSEISIVKMNKKGVKMVISAAGMAICLLCGGCAGKKPDMGNENAVENEAAQAEEDGADNENTVGGAAFEIENSDMQNTDSILADSADDGKATVDKDNGTVDYRTCPSGTIVEKALTAEETGALFAAEPISDEVFDRINGISYVENDQIGLEDLRYLRLLYCGFDGETHVGEMITNAAIADEVLEIFHTLYENDYPIEKMLLIDEYGGDDDLAVADNNTSCFNYRMVAGSTKLSRHALGMAIDINPFYNPYVTYPDGVKHSSPAGSEPYADRSADFPYKIGGEDDLCLQLFDAHGYTWGGRWKSVQDYQHFQK